MSAIIPPDNSLRVMNNDDLNAYSIQSTNSSVQNLISPWISIPSNSEKWRWVFTSLAPASLAVWPAEKSSTILAQAFAFMRQELTTVQEVVKATHPVLGQDTKDRLIQLRRIVEERYEKYCVKHCLIVRIWEIFLSIFPGGMSTWMEQRRLLAAIDYCQQTAAKIDSPQLKLRPFIYQSSRSLDPQRFNPTLLPASNTQPNLDLLQKWVNIQHQPLQPFARALAQAVIDNYVGFDRFIDALDDTIKQVEDKCTGRPMGIVTQDDADKSGYWVRRLISLKQPPAADKRLLEMHQPLSEEEAKIRDWVIVDDATYSATQLRNEILPTFLRGAVKQIPTGEINVHIAIPFMTQFAVDYLKNNILSEICDNTPALKAHAHRIKILPTYFQRLTSVSEFIDKLTPDEQAPIREYYRAQISANLDKLSPTYFAHKVGDSLSFPKEIKEGHLYPLIRDGQIVAPGQLVSALTTVPKITPPYKSRPDRL